MIEKYKALEADLETERLRLAACGVAALGYFDGCKDEYRSASLEDTLRLYEINKELKAENEESKNALGDYFCSADDLAPAIRRLVSAYQERNQTAAKFMQELNETEAERDELTRQLAEYKAENERLNTVKRQLAEYKADAANWRAHQKRKQEVIAAGMGRKILRDLETHDALPAFYKEMKKGATE
jgi:DNA repair exonuclease SbcCD ATPase subunit